MFRKIIIFVIPVCTCWMSASIARCHSFFHIGKRRIGKAIWTKNETFAFGSSRTIQQLEIVKRALQLLVQFDSSVLWQHVGFVTILTIQTSRFCHDVLHVPAPKKSWQEFLFRYLGYLRFNLIAHLRHFPHLENGLPLSAKLEKLTSKSWSMPSIFLTKYWNFNLKTSNVCFKTDLKLALPCAIKSSCSSTADLQGFKYKMTWEKVPNISNHDSQNYLMCGKTRSGSIFR